MKRRAEVSRFPTTQLRPDGLAEHADHSLQKISCAQILKLLGILDQSQLLAAATGGAAAFADVARTCWTHLDSTRHAQWSICRLTGDRFQQLC